MLAYLIRRVLQGIFVIFLVSITTFGILQMAPGSPVDTLIGEAQVTQAQIDALEAKWGLDRPWYEQYVTWIGNMLKGDFGTSLIRTGVPVSDMLKEAAPVTFKLNLYAFLISTAISVPVGIAAAVKRNSLFDYAATVLNTVGIAVPAFWAALMAIIIFSLKLDWFPSSGSQHGWKSYVLPVAILATQETALLARLTRGATLEILKQDYVTTARAKGLQERTVLMRHIVRNAMLPVVTVLGYRLAFLLSGTIVIETIFAWPGIGRLFFDSVTRLDYQVVQAIVLLLSILVVVMNIVTDMVYAYVDPRIRIK